MLFNTCLYITTQGRWLLGQNRKNDYYCEERTKRNVFYEGKKKWQQNFMICKSRYIQYEKRLAYLHKPQGHTAGINKYHNFTMENFHIKKYTSHSNCYYISTCCIVVTFEHFAHCTNGLFITRNSQITVERNILILSHYLRVLKHPVTWRRVFGALCNKMHSFLRLMANFVRGIYSDSPTFLLRN
jgi:hypothetical protein